MRRRIAGSGVLGILLVGLVAILVVGPGLGEPGAAQEDGADPTATRAAEQAQLADLQTRVAVLSTEVALLGGAEAAGRAGRLGGSRASFDAAYGAPTGFTGADEVTYDVPDLGRLTATFAGDRAERLVITPDRPADKPLTEADPADWSLDEAREIAARFAPDDASLGPAATPAAGQEAATSGTSEALATVAGASEESGCPPATDRGAFTVGFTSPTLETVSAITLEVTAAGGTLPPSTPTVAEAGRANRGGNAVANTRLGGTVTVNGVRVSAVRARPDAKGTLAPAPDHRLVAIEVTIANATDRDLAYELSDFVLVGADGRELTAVCGGVDPAITRGELAVGKELDGWVTFQAPADFEPERFVYLVGNARVGFGLE